MAAATLSRGRLGSSAAEHFRERRLRVDELVYEEIARRRTEPYLEAREDLLSALVLTRDEEGEPMSDSEIRDQLVSPIVAGFEGTAIAVSSILDLLLRHPSVLDRLRAELSGGDDAYLNAVIKEALRARTIVSGLGRKVAERPYELGGYVLRPGTEINPSIVAIHRRADLHPDPHEFRPERFLGPDPPDPHTWLPFGGGRRRCLGASFATFELGVVIRRVLERASLEPAGSRFRPSRRPFGHVVGPERRMRRGVVATPKGGALVLQRRRPVPATGSDPASTRALAAS